MRAYQYIEAVVQGSFTGVGERDGSDQGLEGLEAVIISFAESSKCESGRGSRSRH